jgi:hypothetical protein
MTHDMPLACLQAGFAAIARFGITSPRLILTDALLATAKCTVDIGQNALVAFQY